MHHPNAYQSIAWFPSFAIMSSMTELKRGKQTLWEYYNGILNMAQNFETDSSDLFHTVFYASWWHSLKQREVRLKILETVKIKINDVDVIYYADNQTFGYDIKVSVDVDGCIESKSMRCLY